LPGDRSETRASATGCPGVAASPSCSLTLRSLERRQRAGNKGRWPPQRLRLCHRRMTNGQLALATVALLRSRERERCWTEAVIPSPSGDKASRNPRTMRSGGWPGRICFVPNKLGHGFARICADQNKFPFSFLLPLALSLSRARTRCRTLCSGLVFAGLPQNRCSASQLLHN
jgi:hypothetical protein